MYIIRAFSWMGAFRQKWHVRRFIVYSWLKQTASVVQLYISFMILFGCFFCCSNSRKRFWQQEDRQQRRRYQFASLWHHPVNSIRCIGEEHEKADWATHTIPTSDRFWVTRRGHVDLLLLRVHAIWSPLQKACQSYHASLRSCERTWKGEIRLLL